MPLESVLPLSTLRLSLSSRLTPAPATATVSAVMVKSSRRARLNRPLPDAVTVVMSILPSTHSIVPDVETSMAFPPVSQSVQVIDPLPECNRPMELSCNTKLSKDQSSVLDESTLTPALLALLIVPPKSRFTFFERTTPSCDWLSRRLLVAPNRPLACCVMRIP